MLEPSGLVKGLKKVGLVSSIAVNVSGTPPIAITAIAGTIIIAKNIMIP